MKTKLLTFAALSLLSTGAYAVSTNETAENINFQTQITRKAIDNVIQDMRNQKTELNLQTEDYEAQTKSFQENVERALLTFEKNVNEKVLAKAQPLVNKYNAIKNSSLSDDQKELFLKKQEEIIVQEFKNLSQIYQEEIRKVYTLIPSYKIMSSDDFSISFSNPRFSIKDYSKDVINSDVEVQYKKKTILKTNVDIKLFWGNSLSMASKDNKVDYNIDLASDRAIDSIVVKTKSRKKLFYRYDQVSTYSVNLNKMTAKEIKYKLLSKEVIFEKLVSPEMKGSCQTEDCALLRAGDYMTLLKSLDKNINIPLDFELKKGYFHYVSDYRINPPSDLISRCSEKYVCSSEEDYAYRNHFRRFLDLNL